MQRFLTALCLALAAACSSLGSNPDGTAGLPIVVRVTVLDESGGVMLDARWDTDTFIGKGSAHADAEAYGKFTGLPLYGPLPFGDGAQYVKSKSRDVDLKLEPGEPLPAWCALYFRPGEAARLGYTFLPAS